jgi:uncharacterized protein
VRLSDRYRQPADLPQRIAIFPLRGAIILPRASLPLNIFEPRYLQMLDDVISSSRVFGLVQPASGEIESPIDKTADLKSVGCVGRVTAYQELDDGRILITLTGIVRFDIRDEPAVAKPYRVCIAGYERFLSDFRPGAGESDVDRNSLLKTLKSYLETRDLRADWSAIAKSSNEMLINSLSVISPFGPEEKQALLEAPDLRTRAETLVALAEMEIAAGAGGTGSTLQ